MLEILVADDHPVVRRGLRQIIAETTDMFVADEASDGWEVLSKVRSGKFDVVILDIAMPGKDGLEVLAQLKSENPGLAVLMLSIHPEEQFAVRALKAGASGYLVKESAPDELVTAIRRITKGGKYISQTLAEKLASVVQDSGRLPCQSLSNREFQVMRLIASGKTVTEVARTLLLSTKTVSTYRVRILDKMGLKNNAELTRYALKNRLVD